MEVAKDFRAANLSNSAAASVRKEDGDELVFDSDERSPGIKFFESEYFPYRELGTEVIRRKLTKGNI